MAAHKFRVNKTRRQTNQQGGGVGGGRLVLSFVLVLGCANNKFVTSRFDSCVSQRAAPLVATKPQYGRRVMESSGGGKEGVGRKMAHSRNVS